MRRLTYALIAVTALLVPTVAQAAPSITITTPVTGAQYVKGSVVNASFSCAGATSCTGTFANGTPIWTGTLGTAPGGYFSFQIVASDGVTTVTKSADYNVAIGTAACPNGYVALTFDDGPTPMTQRYVDALVAGGAKATFFDIGNLMSANPTAVRYVTSHGMALQDHTMTHPDLTSLTDAQITAELSGQQKLALSIAGVRESLYRPPYAAENGNTWNDAFALGLMETTWTWDSNDWMSPRSSTIVSGVLANSHDQSIILMHDGYPNTLAAIPQILAGLKTRGLCPGNIVQSWDSPINNQWGFPMFVNVVPF
jgi:peptidoglycan/xylan/chitin deacetylase (PgdA/CDA1 family)